MMRGTLLTVTGVIVAGGAAGWFAYRGSLGGSGLSEPGRAKAGVLTETTPAFSGTIPKAGGGASIESSRGGGQPTPDRSPRSKSAVLPPVTGSGVSSVPVGAAPRQPPAEIPVLTVAPAELPPSVNKTPEPAPEGSPEPKPARQSVEIFRPDAGGIRPAPLPPTPLSPPSPAPAVRVYNGPLSGLINWSGQLEKDKSVTIQGGLPGVPVMISIDTKEFAIVEPPSPSNGWNSITIRSKNRRHTVVSIQWTVLGPGGNPR